MCKINLENEMDVPVFDRGSIAERFEVHEASYDWTDNLLVDEWGDEIDSNY